MLLLLRFVVQGRNPEPCRGANPHTGFLQSTLEDSPKLSLTILGQLKLHAVVLPEAPPLIGRDLPSLGGTF